MRRTGKYAYVDGIGCTQAWEFGEQASVTRYSASCTPGASATTEGNVSQSGSVTGIGYLPPMPSDDDVEFIGVASAKPGELLNYIGDVLFNQTTLNIPTGAGGVINWQSQFAVQGVLAKETVTAYEDASRTPGPAAKYGKISIEGTPDSDTFTDVAAVQNIVVTFSKGLGEYVDDGEIFRETGNLEVDLSFEVKNDDMYDAAYALNSTKRVRVYVTPTLFCMLDAVTFREHSNIQFDRRNNNVVGYNVNGYWTAIRQRTPAALGEILLPGGAQYYGEP